MEDSQTENSRMPGSREEVGIHTNTSHKTVPPKSMPQFARILKRAFKKLDQGNGVTPSMLTEYICSNYDFPFGFEEVRNKVIKALVRGLDRKIFKEVSNTRFVLRNPITPLGCICGGKKKKKKKKKSKKANFCSKKKSKRGKKKRPKSRKKKKKKKKGDFCVTFAPSVKNKEGTKERTAEKKDSEVPFSPYHSTELPQLTSFENPGVQDSTNTTEK